MKKPTSFFKSVSPWVVGGASGVYNLMRSRRLSLAAANPQRLLSFLARQSDVVVLMASNQLVWYWLRRESQRGADEKDVLLQRQHHALFQLREMLTVQRLAITLLQRRMAREAYRESIDLVQRLQRSIDEGVRVLRVLDAPLTTTSDHPTRPPVA